MFTRRSTDLVWGFCHRGAANEKCHDLIAAVVEAPRQCVVVVNKQFEAILILDTGSFSGVDLRPTLWDVLEEFRMLEALLISKRSRLVCVVLIIESSANDKEWIVRRLTLRRVNVEHYVGDAAAAAAAVEIYSVGVVN